MRSSIPPWPGIRLPESLMCRFLFIIDSIRSPNVAKTEQEAPRPSHHHTLPGNPNHRGQTSPKSTDAAHVSKKPPKNPSQVFWGLMRSNNLCLPKAQPKMNAPVSLSHIKMKRASRIWHVISIATAIIRANGSPTYIIAIKL